MGLGKTIQAIAAALLLRKTAGAHKALIVCPASLKHQWSREIDRACGERAIVVDGPRSRRLEAYASWSSGFVVVNYELILRDLDPIRAAAPQLVVLDEAQRIKNWNTKTARSVKQLTSPHAFVLTGTPLENRLGELHSLVEFLHPRALGPRWRLTPFHAVTDGRGRVIAYEGLDVLRSRLEEFFVRRERHAVVDQLPERTDNTFWTGMTPAQRGPYRRHAVQAAALLGRREGLSAAEVGMLFRALTGMRILCNAWAQYEWEEGRSLVSGPAAGENDVDLRRLGSPKLEEFARVIEDLLDASDEKIVVFSQWARMLRLARFAVGAALERRDLRAELFHGGLSSPARAATLDAFRVDAEFRILFSTDAGGLGLNLQHASIVVNLDVPWNPAVLEQRVGRVHRMGQRRSVQVLHFVTRGAIEERVRQVSEEKRALFDGLLVDGADKVVFDARERSSFVDRMRRLIDDEKRGQSPFPGKGDRLP
jgi:SNF2 family DNA or RNA helicase